MDSEHRHELEENSLAAWLADTIEKSKPYLPAAVVGVVLAIAGMIGYSAWQASQLAARADRWQDYARAVEGGQPDLVLLRQAADSNPGTEVQEWADLTWADGRLFEAARRFFQDRTSADKAIADAVEVYERLVASEDRVIAGRASYQLARGYEMQGDLDKAGKQYARVTGPFAPLAAERVQELEKKSVEQAYEWITASKTAPATTTNELPDSLVGDLVPDEIALPNVTTEEADATLDDLLGDVDQQDEVGQEASAAESAAETDASSDDSDSADGGSADGGSADGGSADSGSAETAEQPSAEVNGETAPSETEPSESP